MSEPGTYSLSHLSAPAFGLDTLESLAAGCIGHKKSELERQVRIQKYGHHDRKQPPIATRHWLSV